MSGGFELPLMTLLAVLAVMVWVSVGLTPAAVESAAQRWDDEGM